eukprot:scaffold16121_cov112-Isochrysis_galbana.AAC.5
MRPCGRHPPRRDRFVILSFAPALRPPPASHNGAVGLARTVRRCSRWQAALSLGRDLPGRAARSTAHVPRVKRANARHLNR